jgi:hypothetical protein
MMIKVKRAQLGRQQKAEANAEASSATLVGNQNPGPKGKTE